MALNKKTGGRPKGVPNKTTAAMRERIMRIFDDYYTLDKIKEDLDELTAYNRLKVYLELVPYVCAKPKDIEGDGGEGGSIEDAMARMLTTYEGKN